MKEVILVVNSGLIESGDRCAVKRDVLIEGQIAFRKGELVLVESISPNPQRPEYKYIVSSNTLQKRFQLSDADLLKPKQYMPTPQRVQGSSRKLKWVIPTLVMLVLITAVIGVVMYIYVGKPSRDAEKVAAEAAAVYERTQDEEEARKTAADKLRMMGYPDSDIERCVVEFLPPGNVQKKTVRVTLVKGSRHATREADIEIVEEESVEKDQPSEASPSTAPEPTPPAPPPNPPTITKAEYDQLQQGMTYEQVVGVIGGEPKSTSESTVMGSVLLTGTWYGGGGSASMEFAVVVFDNGKLSHKSQTGLK